MLGDMEMVHCAQRDAPTMRRLSVDLMAGAARDNGPPSLRRLSTSSVASTQSSITSASSSPTYSSSLPSPHGFWPERMASMSGLFRTTSLPVPAAERSPVRQQQSLTDRLPATPENAKLPSLIRTLSKGMDAFR